MGRSGSIRVGPDWSRPMRLGAVGKSAEKALLRSAVPGNPYRSGLPGFVGLSDSARLERFRGSCSALYTAPQGSVPFCDFRRYRFQSCFALFGLFLGNWLPDLFLVNCAVRSVSRGCSAGPVRRSAGLSRFRASRPPPAICRRRESCRCASGGVHPRTRPRNRRRACVRPRRW